MRDGERSMVPKGVLQNSTLLRRSLAATKGRMLRTELWEYQKRKGAHERKRLRKKCSPIQGNEEFQGLPDGNFV